MQNRWLYDGVAKAEGVNTDDPNFQFNIGGTLWADWMAEYGVLKDDTNPIQAEDGNLYARPVFTSQDQADQVLGKIQEEHWNNALQNDDPFLEFARTYTQGYNAQYDTLDDNSKLRLNNYADILASHYDYGTKKEDLEQAVGNVKNIKELQRYEPHLKREYPNHIKLIDDALASGQYDVDGIIELLHDAKRLDPKFVEKEGRFNAFVDNFQAGTYHLIKDLGGSINWLDPDNKNVVGDAMIKFGEEGTGDLFLGAKGNRYITEDKPFEFSFDSIMDDEFWVVHGAQTIPAMLSFLIPGTAGMKGGQALFRATPYFKNLRFMEEALSGTADGLKLLNKMKWTDRSATAVSGAISGRVSESMIEAGGNFLQMKEMGYSDEDAGRSAQQVFKGNMSLVGLDAMQLMAVVTKVPTAMLPSFSKWGKRAFNTTAFTTSAVMEGGEEVLQNYFHHMGRASVDDEIVDHGWWDAMINMDSDSKRAFALGTVFGGIQQGGFALGNRFFNKESIPQEQADKIVKDEYVRFQTLQEVRDQGQTKFKGKITEWLGKASSLNILKDKLKILYTDKEIQQVFTLDQIKQMGYTEEFITENNLGREITEEHPRYDKTEGGKQFEMGVQGWNEALEEGGFGALFGINADNHTLVEEITEIIYERIKEVNPDLYNRILAWEQRHQGKSNLEGRELFSSAFGFLYADIQESGKSADERADLIDAGVEIDEQLFDEVARYFVLDDKNILDDLTDNRMEFNAGDIFVNRALNDLSDITVYKMWEDRSPINMLMQDKIIPTDPGSPTDFLEKKREVETLEEILFGENWVNPILSESLMPNEKDEIFVPHKTEEKVATLKVDPEVVEMIREEKINEERLEELREINRSKRKEPIYNEKLTQVARSRAYDKAQLESMIEKMQGEIATMDGGLKWLKETFGTARGFKRLNKVEQVRQILQMKEYLDSKSNEQLNLFGGARFTIPRSMFESTTWDANKRKLIKSILTKYKDIKTAGALRLYIPDDLSDGKIKNLTKLMTGYDKYTKEQGKQVYQTDKDGNFVLTKKPKNYKGKKPFVPKKIPLKDWTKSTSGLFKDGDITIDFDENGRRYIQFKGKKQISPAVVSFIALSRDAKKKGFKAKKNEKGVMTYEGMTRPEYNDALARATEIGATELVEQSDDVFNAILDMEYDKENRPDFADISLNWYKGAVDEAIEFTLTELPSLAKEENQLLFRALLGFTSPDNAVEMNENLTIEIYKHIERNGGLPNFEYKNNSAKKIKDSEGNEVGLPNSISDNIEAFFKLRELKGGTQQAIDWMMEKHELDDIIDLGKEVGKKINKGNFGVTSWSYGEFDNKIYGMEMFGFKVGVFTGNLLGHGETGTMDLWMTRQMGRWLGTPFKQGLSEAQNVRNPLIFGFCAHGNCRYGDQFVSLFGFLTE